MIRAGVRVILSVGLHMLPLKSGLSALSNNGLALWSCDGISAARARLRNGLWLEVNPQDYNGRMLYLFGTPDPKVVAVCQNLLRAGDVFLDIGANYGAVGLMCAEIVGVSGQIHLFEPQRALCESIRRCVAEAGMSRCRVHEVALLDRDGQLTIAAIPGHSGAASLVRAALGAQAIETVAVRAAAPAIAAAVRDLPFGAKLDVEGAERDVLPAIVAQRGFRFVVFECNRRDERDWAWGFHHQGGLRYFGLRRTMWRVCLEAIADRKAMDGFHDLLAIAPTDRLRGRWFGAPRELGRILRAERELP